MKRLLAILFLSVLLVPAALAAEPESDAPAPRKQRPKVGLVLSGGGAKGMSHIGALKVIEELGIPVDYVVGTSIGSIMAGFYALGYKADELDSLVRSQDWDLLMKDQIKRRNIYSADKDDQDRFLVTFPFMNNKTLMEETQANREKRDKGVLRNMPSALVSGHNLDQLFTKLSVGYQDDIDFNTLPIPFACVAVDLNTKEEVVFHSGNIVTAIRSSMSIPGYFAPVPYGDRFLVDGGMLNNLPVDVVKKMGADYVITVDLHHFKKDRPDTDQTIPEMISTMLSIMNGEKYQAGREASDIIIEPNTSAYGVLAFDDKSVDALVDSGLVAANRVRPQLESLARHLKEYPADNTPRPPKAIDLNRDSVLISQMEIQGADARDMSWLMSKTEIGPGKYVTGEDMDKAISFCYNTKCFRKINYSIAGKEGDYRLKINFSPQRLHQAGIGFRFDSEEMAAILLGISLNKYRMFGPKLDMKLELSANPELTVTAGYTFHNLTRFNFSVNALNTKFDIYDNVTSYITETEGYSLSDTDRYKMLNAQADYRIVGWKNTDLTFGAKFTYYSILNVDATPEGFNLGEETTSHGWEGFINWHFDNMDASEFARHGLQFNLRGGAEYDYGMTFFDTRFDLKAAIPLSASVTLVPQLYNRWIFGAELNAYQNIVGGYVAGRYLPWQLPFVGINHTYRPTGKVNIARADVRVNLFGQHYLTFIGNYMGEWEFLRFEETGKMFQGHFGAGAAYSINTIIGPIQACVHWSNLSKSVGFYFCLGHQF